MEQLGYYEVLWRQLGPMGLADAAWRRARRMVRRRAWGTALPKDVELLSRVGSLAHRGGWSDIARRASVLEALQTIPGARQRAVSRAERVLGGETTRFGETVRLPSTGVDWSAPPGSDPKMAWAIGRLDMLVALSQGAWAASSLALASAAARRFRELVVDFLEANPVGKGAQWSCAMEVALRATNLAYGLAMLADRPELQSPAFLGRVFRALGEHLAFVSRELEDGGAVPNNHLLAGWVGLFVVGTLFPEIPAALPLAARARQGVHTALYSQVHADGTSFEGAIAYHRLAVELFALAYLEGRDHGQGWGGEALQRLARMFNVPVAYCSEQGKAPQFGDNDSGRALLLRERASLDHGYLAPFGAALLGHAELKCGVFPEEAAWLLGAEGRAVFDALPSASPPAGFLSTDAGWGVLRSRGAFIALSAGPSGQRGVGGHSHNDKLSFELHVHGEPVLVDSGTPTYTGDSSLRTRFRATAAHNVLQVDNDEQSPLWIDRPFALPDQADCRVLVWQPGDRVGRVTAEHRGFRCGIVRRTLLFDRGALGLCLWDEARGHGVHTLTLRFHLPDELRCLRRPTKAELLRAAAVAQAPRAFAPRLAELGPPGKPRALLLVEEGLVLRDWPDRYSPGYGESLPSRTLQVSVRRPLPALLRTVVLFSQ